MEPQRFLRLKQVVDMTALSKSEIYRRVQAGRFPRQRRLSHRHAVWLESDINDWMQRVLSEAA